MQLIDPPSSEQLLAIGQQPLMKFEIYVAAAWVNLCTLNAKNYVEGASVSLGGASMTPNPVAGAWDATIFNEDSIFHPQHPTSPYKDYLKTERLVQISVGATYGGVDYYWQRVIGYMDEPKFNAPNYRVSISGGDYMKRLQETELRMPDNYWGSIWTTSSIASDGGAGVEKYTNADAMRLVGEVNAVPNWVPDECTFDWVADAGGTSTWVGRMITTETEPLLPTVVLDPVFVPVAGRQYAFKFKYNNEQAPGVDASLRVIVKQQPAGQPWIDLGQIEELYSTSWPEITLYFTAQTNDPIEIWLEIYESPIGTEFRFDKFSIFEFVPYWERYYELRTYDGNEKGVHHVTLKPNAAWEDVWQGEVDEGWYYVEDAETGPEPPAHPAGIVFFDPNKTVAIGVDNLKIYYYLATAPEDAVARILYLSGVFDPATNVPYVNEAAAKAAMVAAPGYAATGITIDKIWFEPGTTCLDAIKKLCERGNAGSVQYIFYFTYDGQPVFKPRPTVGAADFAFTDPKYIASINTYQNRNEIKNRIIIKGMRQAEPVGHDETRPSVFKGEDADDGAGGSIELYGERTLTINNHLFQTQPSINAMCTALLAKYKDPKWYSDLKIPFNPVPLEIGDSMSWVERLSPTLNTAVKTGLIRDIKIDGFNTTYKCEQP